MGRDRDPFETAVAALNRRAYSVAEIRERLLARDFGEPEVEETIERLTEIGELDDQKYARLFAADKRDLSGWGPERIAMALKDRGVDQALIDHACVEDREQQIARATEMLAGRGRPLDDDLDRNRALGFLTRRGYAYEIAYEAIRAAARLRLGLPSS